MAPILWNFWRRSSFFQKFGNRVSAFVCSEKRAMPLSEVTNSIGSGVTAGAMSPTKAVRSGSPLTSPEKRASVERPVLRFARLSEHAQAPVRGSRDAAGYDLRSAHDYHVPAGGKALVKTDIQVELPDGCYGRVAPRSGLSWKHHVDVAAGVIDRDYRGNVGVVLFNHANEPLTVSRGDRVAQLILERIFYPELVEVKSLDETERGQGGFGSTGK